jgi:hypothetical protein
MARTRASQNRNPERRKEAFPETICYGLKSGGWRLSGAHIELGSHFNFPRIPIIAFTKRAASSLR